MPRRYYYWIVIIILTHCASFLQRKSAFEQGLALYQEAHYQEAIHYFHDHYNKHPDDTTTLYYLQNCYRVLGQTEQELGVLEKLAQLGSHDENVYLNLFYYYRQASQHQALYAMLIAVEPAIAAAIDTHYVLTRRLYAELITGASGKSSLEAVVFAASQGYVPVYPDGIFRDDDTITNGGLIILLDRLIEPLYPTKFYAMKSISDHSFLYLPYMRLVHHGIMEFNADIEPQENAATTQAARAIAQLKLRGIID